jgi:hypothetical protein
MNYRKPQTSTPIEFANELLNALEPLLNQMQQLSRENQDLKQEILDILTSLDRRIGILEEESSQQAEYLYHSQLPTTLQEIQRSLTSQNQISSSQSAQLSQFILEITAVQSGMQQTNQHQAQLNHSFEQYTPIIQSLQNQIVSSEAKTGDRLIALIQSHKQLQQAIPSPAAFPLKLFLNGEVVTYRGITGLIAVTGILGGMLTWILLLLMPPAIQKESSQLKNNNEKRLEQLEQNQKLLFQKSGIQLPPPQQ